LITGQKREINDESSAGITISRDSQTIALEQFMGSAPQQSSWWGRLTEWLGIRDRLSKHTVVLKGFPSEQEIFVLKDCTNPVFSPDGKPLAVKGIDGNPQLWALPIRKPIGKIVGLSALVAVATLLPFNGLGWLRGRRMRLMASLVPNSVPSTK